MPPFHLVLPQQSARCKVVVERAFLLSPPLLIASRRVGHAMAWTTRGRQQRLLPTISTTAFDCLSPTRSPIRGASAGEWGADCSLPRVPIGGHQSGLYLLLATPCNSQVAPWFSSFHRTVWCLVTAFPLSSVAFKFILVCNSQMRPCFPSELDLGARVCP